MHAGMSRRRREQAGLWRAAGAGEGRSLGLARRAGGGGAPEGTTATSEVELGRLELGRARVDEEGLGRGVVRRAAARAEGRKEGEGAGAMARQAAARAAVGRGGGAGVGEPGRRPQRKKEATEGGCGGSQGGRRRGGGADRARVEGSRPEDVRVGDAVVEGGVGLRGGRRMRVRQRRKEQKKRRRDG